MKYVYVLNTKVINITLGIYKYTDKNFKTSWFFKGWKGQIFLIFLN